jgi:hypothetical protein
MSTSGFYMTYLRRLMAQNHDVTDICDGAYWAERRQNKLEKTRPLANQPINTTLALLVWWFL